MSKWQPIETAPTEPETILVYYEDGSIALMESDDADWQPYDPSVKSAGTRPTHWQPLPDPPEAA